MRPYFLLALVILTVCVVIPRLPLPGQASPEDFKGIPAVEQRYTIPGYKRQAFGASWDPSVLNPECTAREQAIMDQSTPVIIVGCDVKQGSFYDPYNHNTLVLGTGARLEVDHVFPLAAAWDMGAWAWDGQQRLRFANDPANLVVTIKKTNQDKSDQLPSQWMPPHPGSRCWYAKRLAAVARKYGLSLPRADLSAMRHSCGIP